MTEPHKELDPASWPASRGTGHCLNCGTELRGPYCYVCGQSTRQVIKHLPALAEDALDLLFNIDGRIMRTLPDLYLRPGYLAREYFAGHRTRYIPPFRLMFFLSVVAFLLIQLNLNLLGNHVVIRTESVQGNTPAEVRANLRKAEAKIEQARNQPDMPAIGRRALDISERRLRAAANDRLRQLGAPPVATTAGTTAAMAIDSTPQAKRYLQAIRSARDGIELDQHLEAARNAIDNSLKSAALTPAARKQLQSLRADFINAAKSRRAELHGSTAAAESTAPTAAAEAAHPASPPSAALSQPAPTPGTASSHVHVSWLPAFVNDRINQGIDHARAKLKILRSGTPEAQTEGRRILAQAISVLPQTLFVMLPLFAGLLKILYLFRRRLYIEHFIVAMYSHAFIYQSLLLWALVGLARTFSPSWLAGLLGWVEFAIFLWIPTYLLLMQKRVYAQGWIMTLLKYAIGGICYTVLLTFAVGSAALIGLAS